MAARNIRLQKIRFNTQPPEGGWILFGMLLLLQSGFNTQPPEGGWAKTYPVSGYLTRGFNTQPPEGGWLTNTTGQTQILGFNTQPPEGGWVAPTGGGKTTTLFQHTAA